MRIYCIPGIGLDERLFSRLKIEGAELVHIKWEKAQMPLTMPEYARQLSRQISSAEPFCLLGVSFGGMICAELAEILNPEKIFLISSAKTCRELPFYLRLLGKINVHLLFGESFYRWLSKRAWKLIGIRKEDRQLFFSMVESPPRPYYKAAVNCVLKWQRKSASEKIIHIHGDADNIILFGNIRNAIRIKGGTHAMIAYQQEEIGRIIADELIKR